MPGARCSAISTTFATRPVGTSDGINARNEGTGVLSITTGDVTGIDRAGIRARTVGEGLTIDSSAGLILGGYGGIIGVNVGTGDMSITTGAVEALDGSGIQASNGTESGNLSIDSSGGAVLTQGEGHGIFALNLGTGNTSIVTGDVTSGYGTGGAEDGVYVHNGATAGDLLVDTSAGTVLGDNVGVFVRNYGSGSTTIITADVTGDFESGIEARSFGSGLTINSTAGSVTGATDGVFAINTGTDSMQITAGNVTGETSRGIFAQNNPGGTDLSIDTSAGSVNGGSAGIITFNLGSGALNIVTADVTATDTSGSPSPSGIFAQNFGTDLALDTRAGTVTGDAGIRADNFGTGATSIVTGDVNGTGLDGISSIQFFGTDLIIDSTAGTVTGAIRGIDARNQGSGTLSITTGDVSSTNGDGIYAFAEGTDLVVDTSAGTITGARNGIYALSRGSGSTSVIAGDVTGENGSGVEVRTVAGTNGLTIDTSGGAIVGELQGILVSSRGSGTASITTGDVTGITDRGILVFDYGTDITIDSTGGQVTGNSFGIDLFSFGAGASSIVTADVTGVGFAGIFAQKIGGTSLSIDTRAGSVSGGTDGVNANHDGSGDLTITTGDVTSGTGDAIFALNGGPGILAGSDLIIDTSAGVIVGAIDGIEARNEGSGAVSILTGAVTGLGGEGIDATTDAGGTDLTIVARGAVIGRLEGINADNNGTGATRIDVVDVTGQTGDGLNIDNTSAATGGMTIISTGTIRGNSDGIDADHDGSGSLIVNVHNVYGTNNDGVDVNNSRHGDALSIAVSGNVTAGDNGFEVQNYGSGALTIAATNVAAVGDGVNARNYGTHMVIDTSAGDIVAGEQGINALNFGSGILLVRTAGVTGGENGIFARSTGIDLVIDSAAGAVTGAIAGINARHDGTGTMMIIAADVTGGGADGILARNGAMAADLIVNSAAGKVTGAQSGIHADNQGTGALIVVAGATEGGTGAGITAINGATGTDLLLNSVAGTASGGTHGISAANSGRGGLILTTAGATGASGNGIYATNSDAGLGITINSAGGAVSGGFNGIAAINDGSSVLLVTSADAAGGQGAGILAINNGRDTIVNSAAGEVSGGTHGVDAHNLNGLLSITTGDAAGANGQGILALNEGTELIVNALAGAVTGSQNGILADNLGTSILLVRAANVTGANDAGIAATNVGTDLLIETITGTVTGQTDGIVATNWGSGFLSIITGNVTGATGHGIYAMNAGTDLVVNSSAGAIEGIETGIFADQQGSGVLAVRVGAVSGETGIRTLAGSGETWITLGSTAVVESTMLAAIDATSQGGSITVRGSSGEIAGATDGVHARSNGGDIVVVRIDSVAGGSGHALNLVSGGGSIAIAEIGAIIGSGGHGVHADAEGGDIVITDNGDISGSLAGISATTSGSGSIEMRLNCLTIGGTNAVEVTTEGGEVTVFNTGTLTGADLAFAAVGDTTGPILLGNTGTIARAVRFGSADDQLVNEGTFLAESESEFGDGEDLFWNSGEISVSGAANFAGLERLESAGTIAMVNDLAVDSLAVSGDFVGNAGVLRLDVDPVAGESDRLVIAGAATGATSVLPNFLSTDAPLGQRLVLVDAGDGTDAGAFTLAPDQGSLTPFLSFALDFDAADNDFLLSLVVEPKVFEAAKFASGAQEVWYRSADIWSDQRAQSRGQDGEKAPAWVVFHGLSSKREMTVADTTGLVSGEAVLDHSQDFFGLQAGVETRFGEGLSIGVTGGYLRSRLAFNQSSSRAAFDAVNAGLSLSYRSGGFHADALIKYDRITATLSDAAAAGFGGELDGGALGGRVELAYRTPGTGLFIEPRVSLAIQATDLDDLAIENQRFEFAGFEGLRGTAGVRIGGTSRISDRSVATYYLDASAVHDLKAEGTVRFILPGDEFAFTTAADDTRLHLEAGLNIATVGPVSGFFQIEGDIGSNVDSFGGSAGLRIRF